MIKLFTINEDSILNNSLARTINGIILFILFVVSISNVGEVTITGNQLVYLFIGTTICFSWCIGRIETCKVYKERYTVEKKSKYIIGYACVCCCISCWLMTSIILHLAIADVAYSKLITGIPIAVLIFNLINIPSLFEPLINTSNLTRF